MIFTKLLKIIALRLANFQAKHRYYLQQENINLSIFLQRYPNSNVISRKKKIEITFSRINIISIRLI